MIRRTVPLVALAAIVAVAACSTGEARSTDSSPAGKGSPFATCPAPVVVPAMSAPTGSGRALPTVVLPCFTGGTGVDLATLGRPTVINFWASTCAPCRKEMPQLQRFAESAAGMVVVIGVDTADERSAAAAAGSDFGVTYPVLFDPQSLLLNAWGRNALPVTLFVDAHGVVRHEDLTGAQTVSSLDDSVRRYLGISP
jgi:thiol-disulfide isomerase/thioredoxin